MGWWHNAWWAWLIIAFSLFGAITTTSKSIVNRNDRNLSSDSDDRSIDNNQFFKTDDENNINSFTETQVSESITRYCKNCGAEVSESSRYCAFCGEVI